MDVDEAWDQIRKVESGETPSGSGPIVPITGPNSLLTPGDEPVPDWAVIAADEYGVTIEKTGPDGWPLADEVASWAQQEEDKWPGMGLIYMLITPPEVPAVEALMAEEVLKRRQGKRTRSVQVANTESGEYDPRLSLPYPYYIDADATVMRQDFWKGEPAVLMGFQKLADVQTVDILAEDWLADPTMDVTGMFPVFVDEGGVMWRHKMPVMRA